MGIIAMALMNKFRYLLSEGLKSIFTHGFMSFASVSIIVACLTIMGCFSLLSVNIDALVKSLESENEMLAFVDETMDETDARAIETKLEAIDNVKEATFVSKEQAMEDFQEGYTNRDIFEDVDSSFFRHRFIIHLDDLSLMQQTQAKLETVEGVADVSAQLEIAKGLVTARNIVNAVSLVLIVILCIVSVFIMSNTIKLTTFGRREEIAIMKMVGATNGFIRMPFVVEGLVLGVIGSAIAFMLQWGIYSLICNKVMASIVGAYVNVIPFTTLMLPVGLVFLGVGTLVGTFGGTIAIRNYLKV
ncbi:MAG: permease-like cell division protein FtsX [Oscillospiraceae bacterium]